MMGKEGHLGIIKQTSHPVQRLDTESPVSHNWSNFNKSRNNNSSQVTEPNQLEQSFREKRKSYFYIEQPTMFVQSPSRLVQTP